jgi:hypothetical protein
VHSRIFQITTTPVEPKDVLSESDFHDHWFTSSIADYVSTDNDRTEDIKWLRAQLEPEDVAVFDDTGDSFIVSPGGKEAYFSRSYKVFVEARAKSMSMGLTEFASGSDFGCAMWTMKNSYDDKFSFYVSSDEFGTISLDEFIRGAEVGTRYFIGGTLDYHY